MTIKMVALLFILTSCSTKSITKSEGDKISLDMGAFDYRISGYLYRHELKGDLSSLSAVRYLTLLKEKSEESEHDYVQFVIKYKPEVKVLSVRNDFAVCVRSAEISFGLCDIAGTNFVDKVLTEENIKSDLDSILKNLLSGGKEK